MQAPIVVGPRNDCPPRRSGRRRHAEQIGGCFLGGSNLWMAGVPTTAMQSATLPGRIKNRKLGMRTFLRWVLTIWAKALMGFMTWRGMSGNGFRIGTTASTTVTVLSVIL